MIFRYRIVPVEYSSKGMIDAPALTGTAAVSLPGSLIFKTTRRADDPLRPALAYGGQNASKLKAF